MKKIENIKENGKKGRRSSQNAKKEKRRDDIIK
jgi:hypothetical protein